MTQIEIKNFIRKNIQLDPERYKNVRDRFNKMKISIESIMPDFNVVIQGSMKTKTAIKPKNPEHEYDLDVALTKQLGLNTEFIFDKNRLEDSFSKLNYKNVSRKPKCINIVWNKQFNGDFVIMNYTNKNQSIFDEQKQLVINSNNITLGNIVNEVFQKNEYDAYRDVNLLTKYYLRQHEPTSGILNSVALSTIVISNTADHKMDYIGCIQTTISNMAHTINNHLKDGILLDNIPNPAGGDPINTGWRNFQDMKNFVICISSIVIDIKGSGLKRLSNNSQLELNYIPSTSTVKPWFK